MVQAAPCLGPSVSEVGGTYVLHYTTGTPRRVGSAFLSLSPIIRPAFVDASTEPLVCTLDLGGSIDPSTVADGGGSLWLWKSDGNCCGIPTMIFAQPCPPTALNSPDRLSNSFVTTSLPGA